MSDELRERAETLVALHQTVSIDATSSFEACGIKLAYAYLAEHPADDELAVDEAWLRSVGFSDTKWDGEVELGRLYAHCGTTIALSLCGEYSDESVALPCKTRGDVRRLCKALGIELKEQP